MNRCSTDISFHGDFQEGMKAFECGDFNKTLSCFTLIDVNHLGESSQNIFMSYLGLVMVFLKDDEGIKQCRRAVHLEPYNGDVYYNLALAEIELGERRNAIGVLRSGLLIEPAHKALNELQDKMSPRKHPTMRFLSRDNVLNRALGKFKSRKLAKKTTC